LFFQEKTEGKCKISFESSKMFFPKKIFLSFKILLKKAKKKVLFNSSSFFNFFDFSIFFEYSFQKKKDF
jgi:hypothetical protein